MSISGAPAYLASVCLQCRKQVPEYIEVCNRVERESDLSLDVLGNIDTLEVVSWSKTIGANAVAQLGLEYPNGDDDRTVFLPTHELVVLLSRYGEIKVKYQDAQLNVWIYDIPDATYQTPL